MKIELDYDSKLIKLENKVELKKFVETIQKILPDWEDWSLDTNTTINWTNPITINPPLPYIPIRPWWEQPLITFCDGTDNSNINYEFNSTLTSEPVSGKYQIEIK